MPQEQMPERIIAWRSNVDGSLRYGPLLPGEDLGMDETLFLPASRLSVLAERVERAENALRDEREHRAIADEAAREMGAELNAASERLEWAEALLTIVANRVWTLPFAASKIFTDEERKQLHSFLHDGTKGEKP